MKFSNFINLQRGFDLPKKNRMTGIYPLISSNGINDYVQSYAVKGPGVITGRSGTIGNVFYTQDNYWPLNTTLFVSDFKDNNPKYVYYWLSTFNLSQFKSGTGVPTLNRNHLKDIKISVHKLQMQNHIVDTIIHHLNFSLVFLLLFPPLLCFHLTIEEFLLPEF